jgi:peptide/nickel transport system permease protein
VRGQLIVKRFVSSLIVMASVALLTFMLIDLAPGSYLDELAANPQISPAALARMRDQYGLDRPFYRKFWQWGRNVTAGDFGYSFVYQRPIRALVAERLWNTVRLNVVALVAAWMLGSLLGVAAAAAREGPADWAISAVTTTLLSSPVVVLAIVLLAGAARFGVSLGSLFLPATAIAAVWLPAIARHTRDAVLAALDAPHMLAARARGVGPARLLLVHALREALNPLTSLVGVSVAALLSASLPVEVVMAWPGIGQLTFDAVLKRDIFLVVDLVQLSALLLLAGNLAGDLLLHAVDPRIARS